MSAVTHIGKEKEIKALGKDWKLARWTREVWDQWLEWAKTRIPDPLERIRPSIEQWPERVQDLLVERAMEKATTVLTMGSPEVQGLMDSLEGLSYLFYLLLRKNHPDVTEDEALAIVLEVGETEAAAAAKVASGQVPSKNPESPEPTVAAGDLSSPSTGTESTGSLSSATNS